MSYKVKNKILLITIILLIISYIFYYITTICTDAIFEHHNYFLLGLNLILIIPLYLISHQNENRLLIFACYLFTFALLIDLIHLLIDENLLIIDILVNLISTTALIFILIGTYKVLIKGQRETQITNISYEQNQTFIIEYFTKQNLLVVEFSEKFLEKYPDLESKILEINPEIYKSFIHKDDFKKFNSKEDKYRIKFPGMKDYIFVYTKCSLVLESRIICFGFDISEFYKDTQNIYHLLELEKRKIIESNQDFVAKFLTDGTIVYASNNYAKLFDLDENSIIGKNIYSLNYDRGLSTDWFDETLKNRHHRGQSEEKNGEQKLFISWQNELLLNDEGKVEYLITVGRDITELVELNKSLQFQSLHDYLTGTLNRRGLYDTLKKIKNVKTAICYFIEIEHFSSINDYYGSEIGDEILKLFAKELKETKAKIISRISGAQFVVINFNHSNNEKLILLTKMKSLLHKVYQVNNNYIHIHKRIGYAQYPYDSIDLIELISLASVAKNEITDQHLTKLLNYEPYMSAKLYRNVNMSIKLVEALKNEFIDVYFQKIINVQNNEVSFIEALARWQDKDKGFISPQIFFEIAKMTNIVDQLDLYIFSKAIENYAMLRLKPEYSNTILALNISPQTLLDSNIHQKICDLIAKYKIDAQKICIEIPENTFVGNINRYKENIMHLKEKGFLIALDDFGREYSSLSILDNIEFDLIKIDGVFVKNIFKPQNQAIVQMVMKISEISKKQIIAECVETSEESLILKQMKCYLQQGFYFHKPEKL